MSTPQHKFLVAPLLPGLTFV